MDKTDVIHKKEVHNVIYLLYSRSATIGELIKYRKEIAQKIG